MYNDAQHENERTHNEDDNSPQNERYINNSPQNERYIHNSPQLETQYSTPESPSLEDKERASAIIEQMDLEEDIPKEPSMKQKIISELKVRWFLIAVFVSILLAFAFPSPGKKGGFFKSEISTKVAIALIFLCSGFTMKANVMFKAIMQWRLHIFIQVFCFLIFPTCTFIIVKILSLFHFNQYLLDGFLILGCTPTTISSSVVVTAQADGNEAAGLFNSAFGNSVGVLVSPMVLYIFYSGADIFAKVPIGSIILNLFETVLLPLAFGQGARLLYIRILKRENATLNKGASLAGSILLLFVVYCIFSEAFQAQINISTGAILATLGISLFLLVGTTALVFVLTMPKFWGFSRADRIAALFSSPQKTLSVGLALMGSIFGDDPNLVLISLPLVMYNPAGILMSSLLVPKLKSWKRKDPGDRVYGPVPLAPM